MSKTTRIVTGFGGPFKHKQFLVQHNAGIVRTLTFRVGRFCGHYAARFDTAFAGTPLVRWVSES